MQHDNHDMDKKLRQLENQSLPDLSKMDEHWEQMKAGLQPGIVPARSQGWNKNGWRLLIAACITGILCLLAYKWIFPAKPEKIIIHTIVPPSTQPIKISIDTSYPVVITHRRDSIFISHQPIPTAVHRSDRVSPQVRIDIPVTPVNNTTPPAPADPKATLTNFFGRLEKPAQEFVINSQRDTVIMGLDGTALLIRAHTFNSQGLVTLILKEYYSYEDIVTNRLTTLSNDKQLVTGGMIHLVAMADGKEVNIQPGRSIRWFVPDTTAEMKQMQLFTGQTGPVTASGTTADRGFYTNRDTTAYFSFAQFASINWAPQNQSFTNNFLVTQVKVLDLRDHPFRVTQDRKIRAKFYLNENSKLSKEELKALLVKKYSKYDKIVVRKNRRRTEGRMRPYNLLGRIRAQYLVPSVGDSVWISLQESQIYRLPATDTIVYWNNNSIRNDFFRSAELRMIADRYSVNISSLGWINCDRFYNDNRPKIGYVVNLPDSASAFSTFLVFDKMKSMMPGIVSGNRVLFFNVPEGETAKVIAVGVQDNKTVAAMQNVVLSRSPLTGLRFEETDPAAFKQEVATMDKKSGNSL